MRMTQTRLPGAGVRKHDATGANPCEVESPMSRNECGSASGGLFRRLNRTLRIKRAVTRGVYLTDSKLDATADLLHGLIFTRSRRIGDGTFNRSATRRGRADRRGDCDGATAPGQAVDAAHANRRAAKRAGRSIERKAERGAK